MANKYKAKKTSVDGIEFDSRKEAKHYEALRTLADVGLINNLELQKEYELIPAQWETVIIKGKKKRRLVERAVKYRADFVYEQDGQTIVEDVKGYRRGGAYAVFAIKRKMMLSVYGIKVVEV